MSVDETAELDVSSGAAGSGSPPEGDGKVVARNVKKQFGRIIAIEDIDLEIRDNEIFALVGDNGAGKSTLMNVLCGVHAPTDGQLYYEGEPVTFSSPSDARAIGIETVYQDLALMDDLDVATNIFMGQFPTKGIGPLKQIDWEETYKRADEIVNDTLGRDLNIETEVEFFSGGERQLFAISRALAFDPEVIILDEPTSALSVDATDMVHTTLQKLKEDEGMTIIIVSHNIESVLEIADRIGVLYQGNLIDVRTPEESSLEQLTQLMTTGIQKDD
ncbi:ATP-binding cassette domain-containing protein [Halosolutus halophilus]|uniref:ATP-binding cassette domain-containing protein n=1 Tax=Halosolutus halophilus TaxID=1552990 RepID=UPI0022350F82|nr:ATP-binding cassette domain-containing protein [Halosolutus halophilus]